MTIPQLQAGDVTGPRKVSIAMGSVMKEGVGE